MAADYTFAQGAFIPQAQRVPVETPVEAAAPPSTYAVAAVLEGHEGAVIRLAGLTALRSVFILPGLFIATKMTGAKMGGGDLIAASFASSCTISAGMLAWYRLKQCLPGVL